jgi:ElaA protein
MTTGHGKEAGALTWRLATFEQLTREDVFDLFKLRQDVFILEQVCLYSDIDEIDKKVWHLLGHTNDGMLAAYLRIIPPLGKYPGPAIGRVVTAPPQRRRGLGKALMDQGIAHAERLFPTQEIFLSAQTYLLRFYSELGFVTQGAPFMEDGIEHIEMRRPLMIS